MKKVSIVSISIFSLFLFLVFLFNIPDLVNNAIFNISTLDRPSFLPYDGLDLLQRAIYSSNLSESTFTNWAYLYLVLDLVGDENSFLVIFVVNLVFWASAITLALNSLISKVDNFRQLSTVLIILFPPFAFGAVFIPSKDLVSYFLSLAISSLYVQSIISNKALSKANLLFCTTLFLIATSMRNQYALLLLFVLTYKLLRRMNSFKMSILYLIIALSVIISVLISLFPGLSYENYITARGIDFTSYALFSFLNDIQQSLPLVSVLITLVKGVFNVAFGFLSYLDLSTYSNIIAWQDRLAATFLGGFAWYYFKSLKRLDFKLIPLEALMRFQEMIALTFISFLVANLAPFSQTRYNWPLIPLFFGLAVVISALQINQQKFIR